MENRISLSPILIIMAIIVLGAFSYGTYRYLELKKELTHSKTQFGMTSNELKSVIEELETHLASSTVENRDLNDFLTILKARNTDFQNEIQEKNLKVATLQKLTETDQELLQKYSKIYFLNENYVPSEISTIDASFLFRKNTPEQIHTRVKPHLEALVRAARADNIDLSVLSGYRSFGTQAAIKSRYTVVYGEQTTNRFSADQGYSEHQLGTTADFTTKKGGLTLDGFKKTPAYSWLLENAHSFGFILSYPEGNSYYIFEPWHWRFVGISLAEYLHAQKKNFYDLSQKETDPYLIKIFD